MTHRGPWRPEHFLPQNPAKSGCAEGWRLCTCFSFAMAASQASALRYNPSGCDVWRSTGDPAGGVRLSQCVPLMERHGIHVDVYAGDITTYALAVYLQSGRGVVAQGNTKPVLSTSHRSTAGPINHAVFVAGVWGGTLGHPQFASVYDPAADGRSRAWGTAAQGPQTWPWQLVLDFMAALHQWGEADPRTLGYSRAYAAVFPDIEPHVHNKFGGRKTDPFPDTVKGRSGSSLVSRRIRPGPGTQYAPEGTLRVGQTFAAYQWVNGPEVDGRVRWYGSHDGDQWVSAAGITGEG